MLNEKLTPDQGKILCMIRDAVGVNISQKTFKAFQKEFGQQIYFYLFRTEKALLKWRTDQIDNAGLYEDCVIKIIAALPKLNDIKSFPVYWKRIVRNTVIDIYRKHAKLPQQLEYRDDTTASLVEESVRYSTLQIQQAIAALPEKLRQPIVLRFYEKKNIADIAIRLSISKSTVNKRIRKAKKILMGVITEMDATKSDSAA